MSWGFSMDDNDPHLRRLTDARAIRAWTHPLRLRLHGLIGRDGPITAAEAARRLGISHALASHHLRQLEKYGFIERSAAADERERPWRILHTSTVRGPNLDQDAEAASGALEQLMAERAVEDVQDWQRRRSQMSAHWREHSGVSQSLIYLTADEMAELSAALDSVLLPLVERRRLGDAAARPAGALPVSVTIVGVPLQPTDSGG
ncbi:MAG: helix-turn-helix domain-containing protein [Jatrophihabitans sp.]